MSEGNTKATEALADLVGLMLQKNPEAGLYEQFAKTGSGTEYTGAMKKAIVVLHEEGALIGIEQKLGVKFPTSTLAAWSNEQPVNNEEAFRMNYDQAQTSTGAPMVLN